GSSVRTSAATAPTGAPNSAVVRPSWATTLSATPSSTRGIAASSSLESEWIVTRTSGGGDHPGTLRHAQRVPTVLALVLELVHDPARGVDAEAAALGRHRLDVAARGVVGEWIEGRAAVAEHDLQRVGRQFEDYLDRHRLVEPVAVPQHVRDHLLQG